jgi:hypothetical protein
MRGLLVLAALLGTAAVPPAGAASHTFYGTCTAVGTATFDGPVPRATYVVVDTTYGRCAGLLDGVPVVGAAAVIHAEAEPRLLLGTVDVTAKGWAVVTVGGVPFRVTLHHVAPPVGIDRDHRRGYVVTDETPLEAPRCDGKLPWETTPPASPDDCTGVPTIALAIVAQALTPIHA